MRFYEFDKSNLNMRLTGIIGQVHSRIKDQGYTQKYSLDSLLNILNSKDINIDREDFIDMIKNEPLKNMISDIKGDNVIFKGERSDNTDVESPDKSADTLEKMAKRASKK